MSQSKEDRIKSAFSCEVKNTSDLFIESYNYVIPPFQRFYTWSEENVSKLLDDLYLCINTNKLKNNASDYKSIICFLGTLIVVAYQCQDHPEFLNSKQGADPNTLYCVIDGQQRLTTVQLIGTILFERLEYLKHQLELVSDSDYKSDNEKAILKEVSTSIILYLNSLKKILTKNNEYYDEGMTPKLFRVPEDYYDMKNKKEEFTSVIGKYLWDFVNTYFNKKNNINNAKKFKNRIFDNYESKIQTKNNNYLQKPQWEHIEKVKKNIETFINNYVFSAKNIKEKLDFKAEKDFTSVGLSCEEIVSLIKCNELSGTSRKDYQLDAKISNDEFTQILEKNNFLLQISLELLFFAKFFIENLAFTFVKATDENYAFSMFDSLNTSGELLTAYETFKAKYINTTKNYNDSFYQKIFTVIDEHLNKSDKNKKKNATDNLIISFARETFGSQTIGKSLNSQRTFLYDLLEQCKNNSNDSPNKDDLIKELYIATIFWKNIWEHNFSNKTICFDFTDLENNTSEQIHFSAFTSLCMALLINAKHTIVSSVIIRGLSLCYKKIGSNEFKEAQKYLEEIIKTCAVFSTIYRIASGGTEGIDSIYKDLFKDNATIKGKSWFEHYVYSEDAIQLLKELCGGIKARLKKALTDKNISSLSEWQNKGKSISSYEKAKSFSIFVLLCYWSLCRNQNIDITKFSVDESLLDYLTINLDTTVEHIAPQSKKTDNTSTSWDSNIYNEGLSDNLGNLLILERDVNSLINNGDPYIKLALYQFFKHSPKERSLEELYKKNPSVKAELIALNLDKHIKANQQALLVDFKEDDLKNWTVKSINERFSVITEKVWELFKHVLEL